jgi:hypothetical protein
MIKIGKATITRGDYLWFSIGAAMIAVLWAEGIWL